MSFKKFILTQFEHHNIRESAKRLFEQAAMPPSEKYCHFLKRLNQLDQKVTEILLKAEIKYAEEPMSHLLQSPRIKQLQSLLQYWQVKISMLKYQKNFEHQLTSVRKAFPEDI